MMAAVSLLETGAFFDATSRVAKGAELPRNNGCREVRVIVAPISITQERSICVPEER